MFLICLEGTDLFSCLFIFHTATVKIALRHLDTRYLTGRTLQLTPLLLATVFAIFYLDSGGVDARRAKRLKQPLSQFLPFPFPLLSGPSI